MYLDETFLVVQLLRYWIHNRKDCGSNPGESVEVDQKHGYKFHLCFKINLKS